MNSSFSMSIFILSTCYFPRVVSLIAVEKDGKGCGNEVHPARGWGGIP